MHFSTAAILSLFTTTALASPILGLGDWKKDWADKWNKKNYKDENVFHFDKTIVVKADPNQVRNGSTPVPGQQDAKGLFKFGINVADNTICYV